MRRTLLRESRRQSFRDSTLLNRMRETGLQLHESVSLRAELDIPLLTPATHLSLSMPESSSRRSDRATISSS